MNTKRKADLQRKLSMSFVPKPPADLAEKIKRNIPESFAETNASRSPKSLWRGIGLRLAASILIVIASAFVAVEFISRRPEPQSAATPTASNRESKKSSSPVAARQAPDTTAGAPSAVIAEAPSADSLSAPPAAEPSQPVARHEMRDAAEPATREAAARIAEAPQPAENEPAASAPVAVAAAPAIPSAPAVSKSESITATGTRPVVLGGTQQTAENRAQHALEASAPAASGALVTAARKSAPTTAGSAEESRLVAEAAARQESADRTRVIAQTLFGISVDPAAFEQVKQAVQDGSRPPDVNVAAIVNYFAGTTDENLKKVAVQLEGSPAPVLPTPRSRIIRLTIDTPHDLAGTVVGTDARLEVVFDSSAIASYRMAGSGSIGLSQHLLRKNSSVTALFQVELQPNVRSWQKVVGVTLTYRDESSGRRVTVRKDLHLNDFSAQWLDASYRHRLASLGAIWAESLKSDSGETEVARRAEELANEAPRDRKAHELAVLATASSRLRSSGPTGSGR